MMTRLKAVTQFRTESDLTFTIPTFDVSIESDRKIESSSVFRVENIRADAGVIRLDKNSHALCNGTT